MSLLEKLDICSLPLRVNSLWMQKLRQTPRFSHMSSQGADTAKQGLLVQSIVLFVFSLLHIVFMFFPQGLL